jgi:hypothetical protein
MKEVSDTRKCGRGGAHGTQWANGRNCQYSVFTKMLLTNKKPRSHASPKRAAGASPPFAFPCKWASPSPLILTRYVPNIQYKNKLFCTV